MATNSATLEEIVEGVAELRAALNEVWQQCVIAKDERLIFASDDSKGCRPYISEELLTKMRDALLTEQEPVARG